MRTRWKWGLLALSPGLVSVLISGVAVLSQRATSDIVALTGAGMFYGFWAMPLLGGVYLFELSSRYIAAGMSSPPESKGRVLFVLTYGAINLCLWLVGIAVLLTDVRYPM